ncbi:hypothetical protein [Roseburia sp. 1XD42-69]|uniref:hypothetical protein n=1 Tax=Roseburia sp. 1XD42-69 TaxID=2320088 RepID=UPI000EA0E018|nr:hypothetical protein [Roseburia sp. 1XD42-69]RKJ62035.1 hypothetical protein D7Y06_18610 [Roseburia sp. 1XD42-69]
MKRKIKIWCLLFLILTFTQIRESITSVQAAGIGVTQFEIPSEAKYNGVGIYGKFIKVHTSAKAEKLVVSAPEYIKGQAVRVALCDSDQRQISDLTKITSSSQKVTYFVRGGSKYYISASLSDINIKISIKRTAITA